MKNEQLRNFIKVVDCGSINKAAEQLYVSQPSLSRSIHSLEEEMGKELVIRSNRGVTLTPTGRLLYYYGRSILEQFQVLEKLKNRDDLILQFYNHIRSADTEIKMIETTAEEVLNNVSDMTSEIGIVILNNYQLAIFKKMTELKDVEMIVLGTGPLYVHINEQNPLAKGKIIDAKELVSSTYIHLPHDFFSNLNLSLTIDGSIQISSFHKTITMSNYHAIINMLNHTDAFMLGHKWQIEELKHSRIKSMQFQNCNINKSFIIIKRKREILSDAAKIFLEIINDNYADM